MSMREYIKGKAKKTDTRHQPSLTKIVAAILLLLFLIATLTFFYFKGKSEQIIIDPVSRCPLNKPPSEILVLLLDMSDEFSEPQRLKVVNELDRIRETIKKFGLIEVYTVDRLEKRVTSPVIHICNPGTGEDLNEIYQNPGLAKKNGMDFRAN